MLEHMNARQLGTILLKKVFPACREISVINSPLPLPKGKLGLMIDWLAQANDSTASINRGAAIGTKTGVTLEDLMTLTGWQRHTVRAALCRLRQRGYVIVAGRRDGRITYTLHQER